MATATTLTDIASAAVGLEGPRARFVRNVLRNMGNKRPREHGNSVVPIRTKNHPSPMKQAASNRQPGQSHTRTTVGTAINHELAKARIRMHDLADHVFGHIVSTALARDILGKFVDDGFVEVFEGTVPRNHNDATAALDPKSDDVQRAIEQAFEDADAHNCIQLGVMENKGKQAESSSTDTRKKGKGKMRTYGFRWRTFPSEPIDEDQLVLFLNEVTGHAFAFAKPRLPEVDQKLRHRFAAPQDKRHAMALSYEPDGEDMRPDFVLLPSAAFLEDSKTVDLKYMNFTASRLVGEAKTRDLAASLEQVQRYARGLKRAQPWVYYVLAMTVTKDKAALLRGEGSGTERLELMLTDGRGCIEFIRILLGLGLADEFDLGQNPDIEVKNEVRTCETNASHRTAPPSGPFSLITSPQTQTTGMESTAGLSSGVASDKARSDGLPVSSCTRSAAATSRASERARSCSSRAPNAVPGSSCSASISLPHQAATASSASSKRVHSELGDDGHEVTRQKKHKMIETVTKKEERVVFFPFRVYGHKCIGILFTSSSIRGRGTTVFCVLDLEDKDKLLALKMSWQDLERVADQDAVMRRLQDNERHPNVIVPLRTFKAKRNGKSCTTLGTIRGFLDDQVSTLRVENRVLSISTSELKRPVKYFWGIHDFVRGLRGALLGHEYLTKIGVLHRDISENNIVLALRPGEVRGYLIDFDMAILQAAESSTRHPAPQPPDPLVAAAEFRDSSPLEPAETEPTKGLRTGTFPYISYNVLLDGKHTHFDDVESFLYVLLFFLFSYAGPLTKTELHKADTNGFVQPVGSGRFSHLRNWPQKYASWADREAEEVGRQKYAIITHPAGARSIVQGHEFKECLANNWPNALHGAITHLIGAVFNLFRNSTLHTATKRSRTEVSHAEFINLLDHWLELYSHLEREFSNCPFE